MAYKGTKVKTKVGELKYVFIKGEGRNGAMPGETPRMQYMASIVCKKDSELHKHFKAQIDAEWGKYREEFGIKGAPKSTGIKEVTKNSDELDEYGAPKKVPTGDIIITFKSNTTWQDGKAQVIKVFDGKGKEVTEAVHAADWGIGEGSTGIIHGLAQGNSVGGSHKVSLYLSAIQLAKLVKYEGSSIEADDIGGEDLDLDSDISAIDAGDKPSL